MNEELCHWKMKSRRLQLLYIGSPEQDIYLRATARRTAETCRTGGLSRWVRDSKVTRLIRTCTETSITHVLEPWSPPQEDENPDLQAQCCGDKPNFVT